jgi:hypothetical protein
MVNVSTPPTKARSAPSSTPSTLTVTASVPVTLDALKVAELSISEFELVNVKSMPGRRSDKSLAPVVDFNSRDVIPAMSSASKLPPFVALYTKFSTFEMDIPLYALAVVFVTVTVSVPAPPLTTSELDAVSVVRPF